MQKTRSLTSHIVNPANDSLTITVMDNPGSGGANHRYDISGFHLGANPSSGRSSLVWKNAKDYLESGGSDPELKMHYERILSDTDTLSLLFQNGPISEAGVNGLTHEVLLAILIDRLEGFQAGPFANVYNGAALENLKMAQELLLSRTRERLAPGVEGTHTA
jgi:hypothetical protein